MIHFIHGGGGGERCWTDSAISYITLRCFTLQLHRCVLTFIKSISQVKWFSCSFSFETILISFKLQCFYSTYRTVIQPLLDFIHCFCLWFLQFSVSCLGHSRNGCSLASCLLSYAGHARDRALCSLFLTQDVRRAAVLW